jgi:flagellar assembly factor FliW
LPIYGFFDGFNHLGMNGVERTMKLSTLRFGEIEISKEEIYTFPQGIPGFEDKTSFIMLQPDESVPVTFMQSTEEGSLAFIVTNPFIFFPDYEFDLPDTVEKEMGIESEADVMIFSMLSITPPTDQFSLNLLAPIVLNLREKTGKQTVLHHTNYRTKHLFSFAPKAQEESAVRDV